MKRDVIENSSPSLLGSFSEYLKENSGDKILTQKELGELKKQYRREYQRQYYYIRKERENNLVIRLNKVELRLLKYYASKHNINSLNRFLKKLAFNYLENDYVPRNPKHLDAIVVQLNGIANNINQIVQRLHQLKYKGQVKLELVGISNGFIQLLKQIELIQNDVVEKLNLCPPDLKSTLLEVIEINPDKIDELVTYLQKCKSEINS